MNPDDTDPVCFVAGTLVHTKNGLVPIEQIKVGDLVMSQPEAGGERAYRRVTLTTKRSDQEVLLLEYFRADATNDPSEIKNLVLTAQHPIWVNGMGWVAARALDGGNEIQLADGSPGLVLKVRQILMTDVPQVGWTHDDGMDLGPTIDLQDHSILISEFFKGNTYNESAFELNKRFETDVYNVEVEDFHTYYVGEAGVWVHNICPTGASPMGTTGERKVSGDWLAEQKFTAENRADEELLSPSRKPEANRSDRQTCVPDRPFHFDVGYQTPSLTSSMSAECRGPRTPSLGAIESAFRPRIRRGDFRNGTAALRCGWPLSGCARPEADGR